MCNCFIIITPASGSDSERSPAWLTLMSLTNGDDVTDDTEWLNLAKRNSKLLMNDTSNIDNPLITTEQNLRTKELALA